VKSLLRRKKRHPAVTEESAYEALYGPLTRSGTVETYGSLDVVEEWCDWDSITWDWPRYGEIRMDRAGCDF
jgi:hypothetical protein